MTREEFTIERPVDLGEPPMRPSKSRPVGVSPVANMSNKASPQTMNMVVAFKG